MCFYNNYTVQLSSPCIHCVMILSTTHRSVPLMNSALEVKEKLTQIETFMHIRQPLLWKLILMRIYKLLNTFRYYTLTQKCYPWPTYREHKYRNINFHV